MDHSDPLFWQPYLDNAFTTYRGNAIKALKLYRQLNAGQQPQAVLDLGAGQGYNSLFMKQSGVSKVLSVDINTSHLDQLASQGVEVIQAKMQDLKLHESFDLILAFYSLSFLNGNDVFRVLRLIRNHLRPNGLFAGNFFGPEDAWHARDNAKTMTFMQHNSLRDNYLRIAFGKILLLNEQKGEIESDLGCMEFRHVHHFIVAGGRGL